MRSSGYTRGPMFRDATLHDLPALRELLADANDTAYELARVAEEKCFGEGPYGAPVTLLALDGAQPAGAITFTRRGIRLIAVRPDARRRGIGSRLLRLAEERVDPIAESLIVYGEAGNYYLPGVPESDAATIAFFEHHGYVADEERPVNLGVDLGNNPLIPHPGAGGTPAPHRAAISDRDELQDFITSRFGRIWSWETARAFRSDPPTVFIAREAGRIVGFSAHDANNRGLGFFGPMGTDPSTRGKGIGRALLLASLADLRALGFSSATISWAANLPFYERACGARVSLRMVRFSKVP